MNAAATDTPHVSLDARLNGVLLGTAVGDALGLPAEGLSAKTIQRRWKGVWQHRFFFGRGMCSDDTEHTLMVARSLLANPADANAFQRALAWRLRWWLLALPAGVGFATARAIAKLWLGFPAKHSGVFSAGNGPAMRCAIIGVFFAKDKARRDEFVRASTILTHTDPKALVAAKAVTELVAAICNEADAGSNLTTDDIVKILRALDHDSGWAREVDKLEQAFIDNVTVTEFAARLGLQRGITGYAWHTVPVAIYAWWHHRGDFRATLEAVLNCGGDTDTVSAITGAIAGADGGEKGFPRDWVKGICEWPQSVSYQRRLAVALTEVSSNSDSASTRRPPAPAYFWPAILFRNIFFLLVVLFHGFARLIPR